MKLSHRLDEPFLNDLSEINGHIVKKLQNVIRKMSLFFVMSRWKYGYNEYESSIDFF